MKVFAANPSDTSATVARRYFELERACLGRNRRRRQHFVLQTTKNISSQVWRFIDFLCVRNRFSVYGPSATTGTHLNPASLNVTIPRVNALGLANVRYCQGREHGD